MAGPKPAVLPITPPGKPWSECAEKWSVESSQFVDEIEPKHFSDPEVGAESMTCKPLRQGFSDWGSPKLAEANHQTRRSIAVAFQMTPETRFAALATRMWCAEF